MCFNIGVIIGPIMGGLLADPAGSYPQLFGKIAWLKAYPYAPPNLLSAFFLLSSGLAVFFGLAEVRITTKMYTLILTHLRHCPQSDTTRISAQNVHARSKKFSRAIESRTHTPTQPSQKQNPLSKKTSSYPP